MWRELNASPEVNIALLLFSASVVLCLLIGTCAGGAKKHLFMKHYIALLTVDIVMQLGEAGIWIFEGPFLVKLSCLMSFGGGAVMISLYTYCILEFCRETKPVSLLPAHIMTCICSVMFLMIIISLFNGCIFAVDENGVFTDGPLGWIVNCFDFTCYITELFLSFYHRSVLSIWGRLSLMSISVLPVTAMLMVNVWYPVPEYLAITLALISVNTLFRNRLLMKISEQEKELTENKVAIMVSQIQPHFLYNSLNTIYHLCDRDVKTAKQAVSDFSDYLRWNLKAVRGSVPVIFSEELEHVKGYLKLEKLRFDERLNVEYDIETTAFFLPALSVQPLVENAVKHGLCPTEDGGTVTIASREYTDRFEVKITDNGVGYTPGQEISDGRVHIGIENVKKRLEVMCGGSLDIQSEEGKGTQVTVIIPKERK